MEPFLQETNLHSSTSTLNSSQMRRAHASEDWIKCSLWCLNNRMIRWSCTQHMESMILEIDMAVVSSSTPNMQSLTWTYPICPSIWVSDSVSQLSVTKGTSTPLISWLIVSLTSYTKDFIRRRILKRTSRSHGRRLISPYTQIRSIRAPIRRGRMWAWLSRWLRLVL